MYSNIIVIPYRNRERDLTYFLEHSVPLLQKHIPDGKVIIVEQDWNNNLFNRGMLLNIGFKEYEKKTIYFITHDVDVNPLENTIIKYYKPDLNSNTIKGILIPPIGSLGCIVKFHESSIKKINGFPNDYWGWGCEDQAIKQRAEFYNINIQKKLTLQGNRKGGREITTNKQYFIHFNDIDDRKGNNPNHNRTYHTYPNLSDEDKLKVILSTGLNNLQYKILERNNINDYVELIKVSI